MKWGRRKKEMVLAAEKEEQHRKAHGKSDEGEPDPAVGKKRRLIFAFLLAAACAAVLACVQISAKNLASYYIATEQETAAEASGLAAWPSGDAGGWENLRSFSRYMYAGSYGMYWRLRQKSSEKIQSPSEIFLPEGTDKEGTFDESFREWFDSFEVLLSGYSVEYQIVDQETGASYGNTARDLEALEGEEETAPFYMKFSFGEEGRASIGKMQNVDGYVFSAGETGGFTPEQFLDFIGEPDNLAVVMNLPSCVDVYLYSASEDCYYCLEEGIETRVFYSYSGEIEEELLTAYLLLLVALALCAAVLPPLKKLRRQSRFLAAIPVEASLVLMFGMILASELILELNWSYILSGTFRGALGILAGFLLYLALFLLWLLAAMALLQMFDGRLGDYWRERSFLYRNLGAIFGWCRKQVRRFLVSLQTVDLSDHSDRWLLKVVGVNGGIALLCCAGWFFGWVGILAYSVFLFFFLRKYLNRVKEEYGILLHATRQMADGNLQMDIHQDLGFFDPLKEELQKVNQGFKKAVEEEVRSQNMKTELITNVSHDLKTPLTAIITYVNLLKEDNCTEEERKSYVEILDKKSMRLKKLIEDLFEVSKAASGNIQIKKSQVDLAEMVRQALSEQGDRMAEAGIDCRLTVPEERVLMMLDSEKTYRILENLLINVSKYALSGTRAWVSLEADPDEAVVTVKNISAAELDGEEAERLTERFVRGDKSRNTEGSGLGLAIAKSFTELQGGEFRIVTDGDLFKAILRFPREPL